MSNENMKNILIIDDSKLVTFELEVLFKKFGHNVKSINFIDNVMELFNNNKFDYILLDLFMPDVNDGMNLLNNLKKSIISCKLNTKIIIMSAGNKNKFEEQCMLKGADYYIEKTENYQNDLIKIIDKKDL